MSLPDPARYARDAAAAIGARFEDLDDGGFYLFRISKGMRSIVLGAGGVCSFPINSATAFTLSRDKSHTKSALRAAGLPVIHGGLFFAHTRRVGLRGPGREISDAVAFAEALGYPVFCKPNTGSRGNFAEIIASPDLMRDYADRLAVEFEAFLVEPIIRGTEHRVLVHDDSIVFHAVKQEPALMGDGVRSLRAIADDLNTRLAVEGLSPWPPAAVAAAGDPESIPSAGARVVLAGRRNLSADGDIAHFSVDAPGTLAELARRAVAAVGLRLGAVDIFDASPARDLSDLRIIEVNGNPGLKTLELRGRHDLVMAIWTSMLTEALEG